MHDPGGWLRQGVAAVPLLAIALVVSIAGCGGGGSKSTPTAAKPQTITFQRASDVGPKPFTAPADVSGPKTVEVQAHGPFGGSGSNQVCDRDLLIKYLKDHPDRMREWARVVGIDPSYDSVSKYIAKLHPVTLTRDTQVTNHTFVNGHAVGFQSILAAGTAVLVDQYGHPVARCRCGNPLREPVYITTATCHGCPPHYRPPTQCKLYGGDTDYDKDTYKNDYYSNDEYDKTFIDWASHGPYVNCYEAYPEPPKVTIIQIYNQPPPQQQQTQTQSYSSTYAPYRGGGIDCNNPRSQLEYEKCHPPQYGGGTTGGNTTGGNTTGGTTGGDTTGGGTTGGSTGGGTTGGGTTGGGTTGGTTGPSP